MPPPKSVPRIESVKIENYRALRSVHLKDISPLTVLVGPNGSGKSTIFDCFAFLSECFTLGLRSAWDRRNRFRELRTRGSNGPIVLELKYRERKGTPLITYHLEIQENTSGPFIQEEWLHWKLRHPARPFRFLNFHEGAGEVITGDMPEADDERVQERLASPDLLAVNTLGQFEKNPRVAALRQFITGWYLSYLSTADARGIPEAGPQERLSKTGDNLSNVMQHLKERHPGRLDSVLDALKRRVPQLESVSAEIMPDGRLLLRLKDAPFEQPILAKYASDGTLKLLAYLTVLHDPAPPPTHRNRGA